jgi:hypothetical protein
MKMYEEWSYRSYILELAWSPKGGVEDGEKRKIFFPCRK